MAHVGYKLALCALLFFSGCISSGSFVLTEPPRGGFEPGAQVLIVNKGGDGLDIQDDLEHRMLRAGFQVRSELPQDVRLRLSDAEAKKGGRVNYAYRLDYEYHWRTTFLFNFKVIDRFDAELIDTRKGSVIMGLRFRGSKSAAGILDDLVERLSPLLDKK